MYRKKTVSKSNSNFGNKKKFIWNIRIENGTNTRCAGEICILLTFLFTLFRKIQTLIALILPSKLVYSLPRMLKGTTCMQHAQKRATKKYI